MLPILHNFKTFNGKIKCSCRYNSTFKSFTKYSDKSRYKFSHFLPVLFTEVFTVSRTEPSKLQAFHKDVFYEQMDFIFIQI